MKAKAWSDEEKSYLEEEWNKRHESESASDFDRRFAESTGRTARAVQNKRYRLVLTDDFREWSVSDDEHLRRSWATYIAADPEARGTVRSFDAKVAAELGKTYHATVARRHDIDPPLKLDQGGAQPKPAPTGKPQGKGVIDDLREMDLLDYQLVEGTYIFPVGGGLWRVDQATWEWVCGQYSSEGANRTAKEIARDLAWPVGVLQTCLRQSKQYKASLPLSRETIISEPVEYLAERTYAEKEKAAVAQFHRIRDQRWEKEVLDLKRWKLSEDRFNEAAALITGNRPVPDPGKLSLNGKGKRKDSETWVCHAPTSDEHLGMLVRGDEIGPEGENYDLSIACQRLRSHADRMAEWILAQPGTCETLYRTFNGDLFHAITGETEHGTRLHQDSRTTKVWDAGLEVVEYSIQRARQVADSVIVEYAPGNHDGSAEIHKFFRTVERTFRNEPGVEIRVQPDRFAAFRVGKTLHILDHGYGVGSLSGWKAKAQAEVVARVSAGAEFHGAERIVVYYGHRHKVESDTNAHLDLRRLPALCPADDYAADLRFNAEAAAKVFRLDDNGKIRTEETFYAADLESVPA